MDVLQVEKLYVKWLGESRDLNEQYKAEVERLKGELAERESELRIAREYTAILEERLTLSPEEGKRSVNHFIGKRPIVTASNLSDRRPERRTPPPPSAPEISKYTR